MMATAIQMIIFGNGAMNVSYEFVIDDVESFCHPLVILMGSLCWFKVLCDDLRIQLAFKGHKMCTTSQILLVISLSNKRIKSL